MWRYDFSKANIEKAIGYVKNKEGPQPSFLKKFKGSVKGGKLYLDGKQVIPSNDSEEFIREQVLSGKVPLTRDGLYYFMNQNFVGVRRAAIDKVLKSQRIVRETDNNKPVQTRKPRRVNKKGQLAFDLIDIRFRDLGFKPRGTDKHLLTLKGKKERQFGYIFSCVEQLTGLTYCEFVPAKYQKYVTPIAKRCFNWYAKVLDVPISKMFAQSDDGDEFAFKTYKKWGLRHKVVDRASLIESKNAHIQRVLYRIAKMGITHDIKELVKMTVNIVNNTQSSLTKVTPNQAAGLPQTDLSKVYNLKRGKGSGVKVKDRPFQKGDKVRYNLLKAKEKGGQFYKAYKGKTWSKKAYEILQKRGNTYKIDLGDKKKFFHADNLKLTSAYDQKSEAVISERKKALEKQKPEKAKFPKISSIFAKKK